MKNFENLMLSYNISQLQEVKHMAGHNYQLLIQLG